MSTREAKSLNNKTNSDDLKEQRKTKLMSVAEQQSAITRTKEIKSGRKRRRLAL
jgi:hypothetical protein